ncbi:MAG: PKD domain-containing protein, partial [Ferruginibacter sp.]
GPTVNINPVTGLVSGIAPSTQGTYVLTCTVLEFKRGTNIIKSSVRKSLHISVTDCSLTQAILDSVYFSCDGFTRSFVNKAPGGNIKTYSWDFGVPGIAANTSSLENPVFTYPDTGTYVLKLIVNKNLPCTDSAFSVVKVYPVFTPAFTVLGQCKNTPIRFFDKTTTTYGMVDSWLWDFGDGTSASNSSPLANPNHFYTVESNYTVTLAVTNSKGCYGTANKTVLITDKPMLDVTNDTLICSIDTLQLNAIGIGTFLWSPNYNINNVNASSPLISPDVPTVYHVRLTDPFGCTGTDSVVVNVKNFVTLGIGNDTTICQLDPIVLQLSGDALHYAWTENPNTQSLNDPSLQNPLATASVTTRYHVVGSIGKCIAQGNLTVSVVPYPKAFAGKDTSICFGSSAQLHASGGSFYSWSPATYLTSPLIAAPVSFKPLRDIRYTVTVRDTLGCPKPVISLVLVTVIKINANAGPADTTVVLDQPLQLAATGGTIYFWTPGRWLSNSQVSSPVALPLDDVEYLVKVSNEIGCYEYDSIHVKVYKVAADIYLPTAFSPNDDGRNDFFRPISLGLKSLQMFRIYNRWGQVLYSDTNIESMGWDGSYKGNKQEPGTYVWYAEGIDYRNQKLK